MKITEDVIRDLLPLYYADEASADTCALVEAYLADHPEFIIEPDSEDELFDLLKQRFPNPDKEKEMIMKVKQTLRARSLYFGLALFSTMMPLSIAGNSDEGVTWFMLRDAPQIALGFGVAALLFWGAYVWSHRQLRDLNE